MRLSDLDIETKENPAYQHQMFPMSFSSASSSSSSSSRSTSQWSIAVRASRYVFIFVMLQLTTKMTSAQQWFPIATSTTSSLCGALVPTLDKYFDASYQACRKCPTNQYADIENLDGDGNPWRCVCKPGYQASFTNCYTDPNGATGACQGLTCIDCTANGNSTTSDNSECLACDTGVSVNVADGYCSCPIVGGFKQVIIDQDAAGNTKLQSSCASCPAGILSELYLLVHLSHEDS